MTSQKTALVVCSTGIYLVTRARTYAHTHTNVRTHPYMHSRTLTCTHIHTHTYMFKHTHANTHPPTHKHTRTHIHIYSCSPGIISISPSGEGNRISSNSPSSICSRNLKRSDVAELEAPSRFFEYDTTHPQCQLPEYLINTFVCICIDMVWMW